MEQESFSYILERAFDKAASDHGFRYREGAARAWALTGASYLGFALCGLSQQELRHIQYHTRDTYGPIILDCKWYDWLKAECLNGQKEKECMLPGPEEAPCKANVTEELFLEMLDFCREG
jgi:hypothetical protein